jgi:NTE family protein
MKVGFALSGGGARGFAHIGVLKVLVENEIPIDMIAGTSAGSIVAGAFAAGMSVDEVIALGRNLKWRNVARPSLSPLGALSNEPMGRFLRNTFPVAKFEDLKIPFAAVVYNISEGREVVYKDSGDLIFAICASCALPGVFAPVRDERGHLIVDGGVTNVVPVEVVREMGADVVIAVDLLCSSGNFGASPKTAAGVSIAALMGLLTQTALMQRGSADIVIEPRIAHIRPDQIKKREELCRLGEEAAQEKMPEIRALLSRGG